MRIINIRFLAALALALSLCSQQPTVSMTEGPYNIPALARVQAGDPGVPIASEVREIAGEAYPDEEVISQAWVQVEEEFGSAVLRTVDPYTDLQDEPSAWSLTFTTRLGVASAIAPLRTTKGERTVIWLGKPMHEDKVVLASAAERIERETGYPVGSLLESYWLGPGELWGEFEHAEGTLWYNFFTGKTLELSALREHIRSMDVDNPVNVSRPVKVLSKWAAYPLEQGHIVTCGWGCYSGHQGADFQYLPGNTSYGKPMYAVAKGKVVRLTTGRSGCDDPFLPGGSDFSQPTNVIVLEHAELAEKTYTLYMHLKDAAPGITIGSEVQAGQLIAYIGNVGAISPCDNSNPNINAHLHFEVGTGVSRSGFSLTGRYSPDSIWTGQYPTATLAAPELSSPANGATVSGTEVVLTLAPVVGATKYQTQLSRDSSFSSPITGGERSSTSVRWTGFANDGSRWYWRGRAGNSHGWSQWASSRYFTNGVANSGPPAAPALSSPANGATVSGTEVILTLAPVVGATKYQTQLSRDSSFFRVITGSEHSSPSTRWTNFANDGSRWYWRGRAGNSHGWSQWSYSQYFTNGAANAGPPAAPALSSPANGATVSGTEVILTLAPVVGATKYQTQLSRDSSFFRVITGSELSSPSTRWTNFANDGSRWYWRGRAGNSHGWSQWSYSQYFINGATSAGPPAAPALSSPANGATVNGTEIILTLAPVVGATKYQTQLSRDSSFSSPITGGEYSSTSTRWTGFANDGSRWYWRGRAGNNQGWSQWSSSRYFFDKP